MKIKEKKKRRRKKKSNGCRNGQPKKNTKEERAQGPKLEPNSALPLVLMPRV
jgi:hypothetical protein